jgi:hypothetical protein
MDPPWLPGESDVKLLLWLERAHLGFWRQGECILQTEGHYRFRWDGQIAIAGKGRAQGSGAAAGQATDEQSNPTGRNSANQHTHARSAADKSCRTLAFALLASGQSPGIDAIDGAIHVQTGQRQSQRRLPFKSASPVSEQYFSRSARALGNGDGVPDDNRLGQGAVKPVARLRMFDVDGSVQAHFQPGASGKDQGSGLKCWCWCRRLGRRGCTGGIRAAGIGGGRACGCGSLPGRGSACFIGATGQRHRGGQKHGDRSPESGGSIHGGGASDERVPSTSRNRCDTLVVDKVYAGDHET